MGKHIPIDDLFRDKLSDGEEQLNLGAWANMERMLDGKNPYADEEDKRKRRILPFILIFTLLSGAVAAGYLALTKGQKSTNTTETASAEPKAQTLTANYTTDKNIQSETALIQEGNTSKKTASNQTNLLADNSTKPTQTVLHSPEIEKKSKAKKSNAKSKALIQNLESNMEAHNSASASDEQKGDIAEVNPTFSVKEKKGKKPLMASKGNKSNKEEIVDSNQKEKEEKVASEKMDQYQINQNVKFDRKGNPSVEFDTIAKNQLALEKNGEETEKPILTPEQTNPRLVNLSPEQELALNSSAPQVETEKIQPKSLQIASKEKLIPKDGNTETHKPDGESFFEKLRTFAVVNAQKMSLLTTSLINMGYPMIPGISIGANAAVFNPKNNFGGFHVGVNNLKPLNSRLSILTELKYFIRNNSGYTINDITTINKNLSADNATLASQNKTIYTYQVDSSVSNYNFKNFSSLELPVMLQAHFRSFTAYGGVNMAYIFRLNVKENKKNYVLNKEAIVDNNVVFAPKQEMIKRFSRDDFSSRFGLGYTVGASVSLSPSIYIDARMTQNLWDNARSASAREVSSGYFKVPTLQLSLGYRFKQFVPGK